MKAALPRAAIAAGAAMALAAPFATHLAIARGRFGAGAAVLLAGEAAVLLVAALRLRGPARGGGAVLAALVLALAASRLLLPGAQALVAGAFLSHAMVHGSLLATFALSLRPGRTPLITAVAQRAHGGRLDPARTAYTRNVTRAWCVFFAADLLCSATLLLLAPRAVWSLFVNVLDLPLVVAMFALEYAVRRWRFRGRTVVSPWESARQFVRHRAGG